MNIFIYCLKYCGLRTGLCEKLDSFEHAAPQIKNIEILLPRE